MPSKPKATRFVFVYGTLMKGFEDDWQKSAGASFVGRGKIKGKLYDLDEYPGAVCAPRNSQDFVNGELYELRDPTAATRILDDYEEFLPLLPDKSLFVRAAVPVWLEDRRREHAWVYFYNRPVDKARLIASGDYRDKLSGKSRPWHSGGRLGVEIPAKPNRTG